MTLNFEEKRVRNKAYYEAHRDEINSRRKAKHAANREQDNAHERVYREEHRERIKAQDGVRSRTWQETHRDHLHAYQKAWRGAHRDQLRAKRKAYTEAHLDHVRSERRRSNYKTHFGISIDDYNEILLSQNGRCAICGKEPNGRLLSVDHDHVAGKVRGLLCHGCNVGIGYLGDNPDRLRLAADYIEARQGP